MNENKERSKILAYAAERFATLGYSRVSVADFARELKMSKSTLYKHFPGKEQLMVAVVEQFYASFELGLDEISQAADIPAVERIRRLLRLVRERFASLQTAAVEDVRRSLPDVYAMIEERRRRIIEEKFLPIFEQGAAAGYFRNDVSPRIVLEVLSSSLERLEHPSFALAAGLKLSDIFDQVFELCMTGYVSAATSRDCEPSGAAERITGGGTG